MNSPSSSELSSDMDLSSVGSLTPPPSYPSPPPSQELAFGKGTLNSQKRLRDEEDAPLVKKRRKIEPKPRITQHLDLRSPILATDIERRSRLEGLLKVLRKRKKIVVIAGAGISVSAGIPDFRSETGLFATNGKHLFDASVYQTDDSTSEFHDMVRNLSEKSAAAKPTEFHHLIAKLASEGRLMRLYTQNVDGLETSLPPLNTAVPLHHKGPWPRTIQLHGGLQKMVCTKCSNISDFEAALFRGATPPPCPVCIEADKVRTDHAGKRSHGVGKLRPKMLLYNEHNPEDEAIGAVTEADLRTRPDAVIVVGTKMKVPGLKRVVREMCGVVRGRKGGEAIWISREPPPAGKELENCWDLIVQGDSDTVAAHARMRRWDDDSIDYKECSESDSERAKANDSNVKVIIESTSSKVRDAASGVKIVVEAPAKKAAASALLTPAPSPRSKSIEPMAQLKLFPNLKALGKTDAAEKKEPKSKPPLKSTAKPLTSKDKARKSANTKPPKPSKSATAAKASNMRINAAFKVSKPQKAPKLNESSAKDQKLKPAIHTGHKNRDTLRPMAPISPSAARNNGPLLPQPARTPPKQLFPNLARQENSGVTIPPEISNASVESTSRTPSKQLFPNLPRQEKSVVMIHPEISKAPLDSESRTPLKQLFPNLPCLEDSSIRTLLQEDDTSEVSKPETPSTSPQVAPGSLTTWSEPHFPLTRASPSRPYYERVVCATFVTTKNSPSRPSFEKFFLPEDPLCPGQPSDEYTFTQGTPTEYTDNGTARLLSSGPGDQRKKQLIRPVATDLVIDTADSSQKYEGERAGRLKRMSQEIVSPTTIPESMRNLLN